MKRYKFTELAEQAKDKAAHEYMECVGCSYEEAIDYLEDEGDDIYSEQGTLINPDLA